MLRVLPQCHGGQRGAACRKGGGDGIGLATESVVLRSYSAIARAAGVHLRLGRSRIAQAIGAGELAVEIVKAVVLEINDDEMLQAIGDWAVLSTLAALLGRKCVGRGRRLFALTSDYEEGCERAREGEQAPAGVSVHESSSAVVRSMLRRKKRPAPRHDGANSRSIVCHEIPAQF